MTCLTLKAALKFLSENPGVKVVYTASMASTRMIRGEFGTGYIMAAEWNGGPRLSSLVHATLMPGTVRALHARGVSMTEVE